MSKMIINAKIGTDNFNFHLSLTLMEFKEDENYIIYSPSLDITGYGNTINEARDSFETSLTEFVIYTTRKKTFDKVLSKLGWNIEGSRKKPKFHPPLNSDLVDKNPFYNEILNHKNYSAFNQNIEFAIT